MLVSNIGSLTGRHQEASETRHFQTRNFLRLCGIFLRGHLSLSVVLPPHQQHSDILASSKIASFRRSDLAACLIRLSKVKELLADKSLPFGVDLAVPQMGGSARKTNYDYTHGHLEELIDVICRNKAKLFVCAIGVPPRWAVDKLHAAGVIVMNMVGSVRNCEKALEAGVDMICAQGSEGGGHTGDIGTMCLLPQCVDACRGKLNYWGGPVRIFAQCATAIIRIWLVAMARCGFESAPHDSVDGCLSSSPLRICCRGFLVGVGHRCAALTDFRTPARTLRLKIVRGRP